jgi:hypothetical protein
MQLPLNVSPVSASFFGFKRLGIHLVLCVACSQYECLLTFDTRSLQIRASDVFPLFQLVLCSLASAKLKDYPIRLVRYGLGVTPTAGEWKPVFPCYILCPSLFLSDAE